MKDLSKFAGTLTQGVELLIGSMNSMESNEIKDSFLLILNSKNTKVSNQTRNYWINAMNNAHSKNARMTLISNAYLAGAGLRVK